MSSLQYSDRMKLITLEASVRDAYQMSTIWKCKERKDSGDLIVVKDLPS